MPVPRLASGWLPAALVLVLLPAAVRAAEPPAVSPAEPNPAFLEAIPTPYRAAITAVMRNPTITAKSAEAPFAAHPVVYDWLVDHPDRASLAWRRMGVACVEIQALGHGRYSWADGKGSELTWQAVARFADGVVWYATGKVKPGPLIPVVPVQAVAVLRTPREPTPSGRGATFAPSVNVYLLTESRTASTLLKLAGPAAPKLAEQGAEQLMLFFSGPSRHIWDDPADCPRLLAPAGAK